MRTIVLVLTFLAAITATHPGGGIARAADKLVVVELFTSQGCSSCPPADKLLTNLAKRDGVLALSFHIDYWNYIGWKDPYSSPTATKRQKSYRKPLKKTFVYTPQIVVDGQWEIRNATPGNVIGRIALARKQPKIDITISRVRDGMAEVRIPARPNAGLPAALPAALPADVWVVLYDRAHTTKVKSGENKGREITNANVVRSFQKLGVWRGQELKLTLPLMALGSEGRDSCAIIVQRQGPGAVIGVAVIPLPPSAS